MQHVRVSVRVWVCTWSVLGGCVRVRVCPDLSTLFGEHLSHIYDVPWCHHRYSNGTHAPFARVERPVLLFDPSGTPTHLINGVQRYVNDDYTFTLIRRIDHS